MTCLDAGLAYLRLGLSIIPLLRGEKRPCLSWSDFQKRRPTEDEVREWWRRWPDAGLAIVCGRVSSLVVVDCDPRNGDGFAHIEHRLPPTPTAETGGGGRHLYFTTALIVPKVPALLPGVDLQGEASCVVAPPSIHPSGRQYRWLPGRELGSTLLAPLPPVIWEVIEMKQMPNQARKSPPLGRDLHLDLEQVLDRLHGKRRSGAGWIARCPAHDDRTPSLSIGVGHDGRVLVHCFAGCEYSEIMNALRR